MTFTNLDTGKTWTPHGDGAISFQDQPDGSILQTSDGVNYTVFQDEQLIGRWSRAIDPDAGTVSDWVGSGTIVSICDELSWSPATSTSAAPSCDTGVTTAAATFAKESHMSHRHHFSILGTVLSATGAVAATTLTAPAAHADRPVGGDVMVVQTTGDISPFTSVLASCASGTVTNDHVHVQFTKPHGVFNAFKVFTCEGDAGGFTVHLAATFDEDGSVGSWAVTDSWGTQAGLHGSGPLVGIDFPDGTGIEDHYQGSFRP